MHMLAIKARQFRRGVKQHGLWMTLYWAVFGYLKPNRFIIVARDLTTGGTPWQPSGNTRLEVCSVETLQAWRQHHPDWPPEFFQDEIDGVSACSVAIVDGEVAGIIWIYRPQDTSRLFQLREHEAELNYGYVLPRFRDKGVFRDILVCACHWLQEQGYRTVYAGVLAINRPSVKAFLRAEFHHVGSIWHFLTMRPKVRMHR
jgi:RimJ/RimL family protein N-acetyltransferase